MHTTKTSFWEKKLNLVCDEIDVISSPHALCHHFFFMRGFSYLYQMFAGVNSDS